MAVVLEDPAALDDDLLDAWRELAASCSLPYAGPEWCLGFWEAMHAPEGARLRIVVDRRRDDGRLDGVAPMYASSPDRWGCVTWWPLGSGIGQRSGPIARDGAHDALARAVVRAAARDTPTPSAVRLPATHAPSGWAVRLRAQWPGPVRPTVREERVVAPAVTMAADHDAWLASRSRNFRREVRRRTRDLAAAGARLQLADGEEALARGLDAFFRTHRERLGSTSSLGPRHEAAIVRAVTATWRRDPTAVRLWQVVVGTDIVATDLLLVAGGRMCAFNGGIARGWEAFSLGTVLLARAVRDAHELGLRTLDLGAGAMAYKSRFADADAPLAWATLLPHGARYPVESVRMIPADARRGARAALRRLPPHHADRLRRLAGR